MTPSPDTPSAAQNSLPRKPTDLPAAVAELGVACMAGESYSPAHNQTFVGQNGRQLVMACSTSAPASVLTMYGLRCVGITALCLSVATHVQRRGGLVAFIDLEHVIDQPLLGDAGVNLEQMPVFQPESVEETYGIVGALIEQDTFDLVIIDGVGALVDGIDPFLEGEEIPKAHLAQVGERIARIQSKPKTKVILTARTPSY